MRRLSTVVGSIALTCMMACAGSSGADRSRCELVRIQGMCEATVTLDPREADSPDEATALEVRWEWLEAEPAEVPDRVVWRHLTARDARALGEIIDELGKSRCVVEQAEESGPCAGSARIVTVEAEP
jgi:hypothetical protein